MTAERIGPRHLIVVDGMPLTHHARSVCFEMRRAKGLTAAVRVLDMAAAADLVSIEEVGAYAVAELAGWTGVGTVRQALPFAEENSWSPTETEMRLLWTAYLRLPRPVCNRPVFDRDGRFIGTPDLLDVEAGLVGEYDGDLHLDRKRRARDIEREAAFRQVGLECVVMTAADRRDPGPYLRRLLQARSRARFLRTEQRAWTIEPPPWWTPTVTVAQRRALDEQQRARFLRRWSA